MIAGNSWINGFVGSCKKTASGFVEHFMSGFAGYGWKIWKINGRYKLEIDDIVVRNTMLIFELLISKVRALKGSLIISQANGKIKEVTSDVTNYYITIEEEDMSFVANDFIRCQTFSGNLKSYWVKITSVSNGVITISKYEFTDSFPAVGDDIVQCGNQTNTARQSLIYIHADETSSPAIDILNGVKTKSFDGCIKVRLGGEQNALLSVNGLIKALTEAGDVIYQLSPDGSINLGKGAIMYNPATNKLTLGNNVVLTWDNLDAASKENLKGESGSDGKDGTPGAPGKDGQLGTPGADGKDANLLDWVQDWNNNKTTIGSESVISPKMFSGTNNANGLTGVAVGRGVVEVDGVAKTGIIGIKAGKITFIIDAETGDVKFNDGIFKGTIEGVSGTFKSLTCVDDSGNILGGIKFSVQEEVAIMTMEGTVHHTGGDFRIENLRCISIGAERQNTMVVTGIQASIYDRGLGNEYRTITLDTMQVPNVGTVYKISYPELRYINMLIINSNSRFVFFIEDLSGFSCSGKRLVVINANDNNSDVHMYINGHPKEIFGGVAFEMVNLSGYLTPSTSNKIGSGWMLIGEYDNQWA